MAGRKGGSTIAEESLQQRVLRLEESLEAQRKDMEGRRILRKLNEIDPSYAGVNQCALQTIRASVECRE
uniref:Uncharacterized protein n=1 Tax=Magallana gigas TaxID=29159 RepID=K1QWS7_MAGGI